MQKREIIDSRPFLNDNSLTSLHLTEIADQQKYNDINFNFNLYKLTKRLGYLQNEGPFIYYS